MGQQASQSSQWSVCGWGPFSLEEQSLIRACAHFVSGAGFMVLLCFADDSYECVSRREWMGCWRLLGFSLVIIIWLFWIVPSFPTWNAPVSVCDYLCGWYGASMVIGSYCWLSLGCRGFVWRNNRIGCFIIISLTEMIDLCKLRGIPQFSERPNPFRETSTKPLLVDD